MKRRQRSSGGGASMPTVDYGVILADLRRQRDDLDAAIRAIERLAGGTETIAADHETIPAPRETTRRPRAMKAAGGKTARPTTAPGDRTQAAILAALQAGKHKPKEIAAAVGLSAGGLLYQMRRLLESGQVVRTGTTSSAAYHLAP